MMCRSFPRVLACLCLLLADIDRAAGVPQAVLAALQADGPRGIAYETAFSPRYRLRGSLSFLGPGVTRSSFAGYGSNVMEAANQSPHGIRGPQQATYSLLNEEDRAATERLQLENDRLMQENDHLLSEEQRLQRAAAKLRHHEAAMRRTEALQAAREERLKARLASLSSSLAHLREGRNKAPEPHQSLVTWALSAIQSIETPASAKDPEQQRQEQQHHPAQGMVGRPEGREQLPQHQQQQQQQHQHQQQQQQQQHQHQPGAALPKGPKTPARSSTPTAGKAAGRGAPSASTIVCIVFGSLLMVALCCYGICFSDEAEEESDSEDDELAAEIKLRDLIHPSRSRQSGWGMCWCCNKTIFLFCAGVLVFTFLAGCILWEMHILQPILSQCMMYAYGAIIVAAFVSLLISQIWSAFSRITTYLIDEFTKLKSVFRIFGPKHGRRQGRASAFDDGRINSSLGVKSQIRRTANTTGDLQGTGAGQRHFFRV